MALDTSSSPTQSDCIDGLLPGTSLFHGQYRIDKLLNSGGFGITYLATDNLDREVVLKECFVGMLCRRSHTSVRVRSAASKPHLERAMRSFMNEARNLAALSHPNIVSVHQVFEDNDTAYMSLDYVRGHDLLEIIQEEKADLSPATIIKMARKLISAVAHIHEKQLLHCDISPDNICVNQAGEPILIDFGAARKSESGAGQKYTGFSLVKDGYSPYELYSTGGACGPWSDIYSLGASLYHAVSGVAPVDCQNRLCAKVEGRPDPVKLLAGSVAGYPPGFLESIDKAMSLQPAARFQSAQDWLTIIAPSPATAKDRNVILLRRAAAPAEQALRLQ